MSRKYPSFDAVLNPTISEKEFKDIRSMVFDLEDKWIKEIPINIGGVVHTCQVKQFQSKSWNPGKPIIDHIFYIYPNSLEYRINGKTIRLPSKKNMIDNLHIHVFWYTIAGKNIYSPGDYLKWQLTDRNPFIIHTDQTTGHNEIYPKDSNYGIIHFDKSKSLRDYLKLFRNELRRALNSYLETADFSRTLSGRKAVQKVRLSPGITMFQSRGSDAIIPELQDVEGVSPQISNFTLTQLGNLKEKFEKEMKKKNIKRKREEEESKDPDEDVRKFLEEEEGRIERTKSMEEFDKFVRSRDAINKLNKLNKTRKLSTIKSDSDDSDLLMNDSSDTDLGGGINKSSRRMSSRRKSSRRKSSRRKSSRRKSSRRKSSRRKSSRRKSSRRKSSRRKSSRRKSSRRNK